MIAVEIFYDTHLFFDNGMQNADGTNFVQLNRPSKRAMTATLEVMDSHLFAPNERNTLALATNLHLPNFHLVGIELKVRKTADRYFNDFRVCDGHSWAKRS